MNKQCFGLTLALAATLSFAKGCGGRDEVGCGEGTREREGKCIPAAAECPAGSIRRARGVCEHEGSASTCAPGTRFEDGLCVPDGSVLCGQGTTYDPDDGKCLPDARQCPPGTLEIAGTCTPIDERPAADITEGKEPNGLGETTNFAAVKLEAVGRTLSFAGCLHTRDINGDATIDNDFDSWLISTDAATVLDVRVSGEGGMAGGFLVAGNEDALIRDSFLRAGVNLVGTTAERKLFLPAAGSYVLSVADSRAVTGLGTVTQTGACYYMQVTRHELPAAAALPEGVLEAPFDGPAFYRLAASEDQVVLPSVQMSDELSVPALVALVDGAYHSSTMRNDLGETQLALASLKAKAELLVVVDAQRDLAVRPATYRLAGNAQRVFPAAETVSLRHHNEGREWLAFQANEGDIAHVELIGPGSGLTLEVFDGEARSLGVVCGEQASAPPCRGADPFVKIARTGTYYVALSNLDAAQADLYEVRARITAQRPDTLVHGESLEGSFDQKLGARFYALDARAAVWLETALANPQGFAKGPVVRMFASDGAGVLGVAVPKVLENPAPHEEPTRYFYDAHGPLLLVQVDEASDLPENTTARYVLQATELPFRELGVLDVEKPTVLEPEMLSESSQLRYVVRGLEGQTLRVSARSSSVARPAVVRRTADYQMQEYALPAEGGASLETLLAYDAPQVALIELVAVGDGSGSAPAGEIELTAAVAKQAPYLRENLTIPFVSVCPAKQGMGVVHAMRDDGSLFGRWDEGLSATPLDVVAQGLTLFGEQVSQLTVSTNGWLTTRTGYSGSAQRSFGTSAWPAGAIAPFWVDLRDVTVCTETRDDGVTVEWRGALTSLPGFGPLAAPLYTALQARLFQTGRIELGFELPALAEVVSGVVFDPAGESSREPNAYLLSREFALGAGHNTARFEVPWVQVPEPEPEPAPELDAACEARDALGGCERVNGSCTSYHAVRDSQLEVLENQCKAESGTFRSGGCRPGFAYCASRGDTASVHQWTKGVTSCSEGALLCVRPGEPEPEEPEPETPLFCELPQALGACELSTLCVEVYNAARLSDVRTNCKGTWIEGARCPANLIYCVNETDTNISIRVFYPAPKTCSAGSPCTSR